MGPPTRVCPTTQARSRAAGGSWAPALGIGHLPGDGEGPRMGQDRGLQVARLGWAYGLVGQGCGEMETNPTAASLGQGLMSPGVCSGVLGYVQDGRSPKSWAGAVRAVGALRARTPTLL